jgi:hypothetical protein
LQKLNGTVIGKQTVRLSWGRNPANKQVVLPPPSQKSPLLPPPFDVWVRLERAFGDLMNNVEFIMQLTWAGLFKSSLAVNGH